MTLTDAQKSVLAHLRSAYLGPEGGPQEVIVNGRPNLQYTVGMLYPPETVGGTQHPATGEADAPDDVDADVLEGEIEDRGAGVPIAEDWRPSSMAISFVTEDTAVYCTFAGGTYQPLEVDGPPQWQRTPFTFTDVQLTAEDPPVELTAGAVTFQLGSRWRTWGSAYLVTVHARVVTTTSNEAKAEAARILYQVELSVRPKPHGRFLEYNPTGQPDLDTEASELRLRYRNRKTYAVGHGMAAAWELDADTCTRVHLDPVPWFVVPAVETVSFAPGSREATALRLDLLSRIDTETDRVVETLDSFVRAFSTWVNDQQSRVATFEDDTPIASGIVDKLRTASTRMQAGVNLLRRPDHQTLRRAFALAMAAMRLQMRQTRIDTEDAEHEPTWRPFQLGFLLVALESTVDDRHPDRELVDLIWFPTGGGKTEAYLGLAAIEIFRRRLTLGTAGGGTAVITRYTLRLLTAQQFHRAASLICAMEMLRRPGRLADARAQGMAPFSIGLWVGNEVTPGSRAEARQALDRLHRAARPDEANQFQIDSCPWCGNALLPQRHSRDTTLYGIRRSGNDVIIGCPNLQCAFTDQLPVDVVDETIYENPPTFLLATVDKFARLQFNPDAGHVLGLRVPFAQPSMIIQDELHLLSGPLGTTVAVFDAVIQELLRRSGSSPKIVASTATIRASYEQVRGLYGRDVALYPPSGLDDDHNFFSRPVTSGEGRLYIGLMPQSLSQASAVVAAATPLFEIPGALAPHADIPRDAYWTTVMYHNSLRELGRTATLVADDVNARLGARADRLGLPHRQVRPDRVLELTSRRGPSELPNDLRELSKRIDSSDDAVDAVLSSNMLSVGIDVPRLALMMMAGQPKTTAEYIQATSRVGRGRVHGVVVTLFRSNRARDRSHFETFRGYHESLYRTVEPTSVTPWSRASRERSLAGALVALLRQTFAGIAPNDAARRLDLGDDQFASAIKNVTDDLARVVGRSDPDETEATVAQITSLLNDWNRRAADARATGTALSYDHRQREPVLLKRYGQTGEGWLVADSMRSVEPNVAIQVREPQDGN